MDLRRPKRSIVSQVTPRPGRGVVMRLGRGRERWGAGSVDVVGEEMKRVAVGLFLVVVRRN